MASTVDGGQHRADAARRDLQQVGADAAVVEGVAVEGAARVVVGGEQVDALAGDLQADAWVGSGGGQEGVLDGGAGVVVGVQDARHRVGALEREVEVAVLAALERHLEAVEEPLLTALGPSDARKWAATSKP